MSNPKCYQLWQHRKWILTQTKNYEFSRTKTSDVTKKVMNGELMVCTKFLNKDERNFHAWNYRYLPPIKNLTIKGIHCEFLH